MFLKWETNPFLYQIEAWTTLQCKLNQIWLELNWIELIKSNKDKWNENWQKRYSKSSCEYGSEQKILKKKKNTNPKKKTFD